jgi:hypothetical protein
MLTSVAAKGRRNGKGWRVLRGGAAPAAAGACGSRSVPRERMSCAASSGLSGAVCVARWPSYSATVSRPCPISAQLRTARRRVVSLQGRCGSSLRTRLANAALSRLSWERKRLMSLAPGCHGATPGPRQQRAQVPPRRLLTFITLSVGVILSPNARRSRTPNARRLLRGFINDETMMKQRTLNARSNALNELQLDEERPAAAMTVGSLWPVPSKPSSRHCNPRVACVGYGRV